MSTQATEKKKRSAVGKFFFGESEEIPMPTTVGNAPVSMTAPTFPQQTAPSGMPSAMPMQNGVGIMVPEIKEDLEKLINDSNFPGEDYLELREAIKANVNAGIPNEAAIKSAYAILSTRGLTKERALQTGNDYIGILNSEKENYLSHLNNQSEEKIGVPQREIASLEEQNRELAQKIQDITKQITDNNSLISEKKVQITQAQSEIEQKKLNYEFTHAACVKSIQDDLTKIQQIIQ